MRTFLYDYLQNPAQAIADARQRADHKFSNADFSEDKIYAELGTPEFRLYEQIVIRNYSPNAILMNGRRVKSPVCQ